MSSDPKLEGSCREALELVGEAQADLEELRRRLRSEQDAVVAPFHLALGTASGYIEDLRSFLERAKTHGQKET